MDREIFVKTVEETPQYRIDEVKVWVLWYGYKPMKKLYLKIDGKLIAVRRYDSIDEDSVLPRHLSQVEEAFKRGYFCLYGKGDPLEEFSDPLEDFTQLVDCPETPKVKRFWGNHKKYSAAFYYIVWNEKIIEEIKKRLNQPILGEIVYANR